MRPFQAAAALAAIAGGVLASGPLQAQSAYPNKPVQLVVPYGAGTSDIMGRVSASCMATRFKQPVLVLNKPGANAELGGVFVKNAPPDGYTLILTSSATVTDLATKRNPTFDVRQDLEPITKLGFGIQGFFVNAGLPVSTIGELIAYSKANPGKLNYATTGVGSVNQLSTEAFALNAGIQLVHVPYPQGTGALLNGLMSGEIQIVMTSLSSAQPALATGKIRMLSVLEAKRSPLRPNLQTLVEALPGMANFTGTLWYGFFAPPRTPRDIIQKLHGDITACLRDPGLKAQLQKLGYEESQIVANTPEEFRASIIEEINQLKDVVQRAKIPLL